MGELKAINVVPHFMRLHEWVALEEGHFQAEGLEPRILDDVMHQVSSHGADQYFERPQDAPFVKAEEVANSACEWGSICNAGAGMGKFVPDLYGVARFAFFVRQGSRLTRLSDSVIGPTRYSASSRWLLTIGEKSLSDRAHAPGGLAFRSPL